MSTTLRNLPVSLWIGRSVCVLALWAGASACGDVSQENTGGAAACDASYCVDCADPCCYDLGYC